MNQQTLDEKQFLALYDALEDEMAEVVTLYNQKSPLLLKEINQLLERDELEAAADLVHTLKGSSTNLGLTYLVALCQELEDGLRRSNQYSHHEALLYKLVCSEYENAQQVLMEFCTEQSIL